jgi:glycosyltransferase involved in cell wall biosynthesis
MYVGRVIPSKGPDVLVRAIRRLAHRDVELTVIGSAGFDAALPLTSYEKELRRLAEPLGERVTFHPFTPRKETARMLATAHVVVVPSRWPEPFALTALEGMASGAAVIGSAIGGIPETVEGTGVLVPPDDVDMLASAIQSFTQDRGLLEAVRKRCLAHARSRGWATVSAEFYAALGERH